MIVGDDDGLCVRAHDFGQDVLQIKGRTVLVARLHVHAFDQFARLIQRQQEKSFHVHADVTHPQVFLRRVQGGQPGMRPKCCCSMCRTMSGIMLSKRALFSLSP